MKHYQTLLNTISTANLTHEEVLEEVDRFIALCYPSYDNSCSDENSSGNVLRLKILTDIICNVPMPYDKSERLLSVIKIDFSTCDDLTNFPTLLAHLSDKQSELTQCVDDDLVLPHTTLVDFTASGSSHMTLLFWRSLERLMREIHGADSRRLEDYFVMMVNVIKQSPYLDLEGDVREETKPFSSRMQKMFLYLSSIDSIMSDHKGNLLNSVEQNLSSKIGQSIFIRNEPISSLDLPFVNLAYHVATSFTLPAQDTVQDLLSQLLAEFKPHDVITREMAAKLVQNERTMNVVMAMESLRAIDVRNFVQGEDCTVFLINLYNLMWTHALLILESTDEGTGLVSQSGTCRFLTKRLVAYHIGSLGLVSLHHIESILLHNYSHVFGSLVDTSTPLCTSEPVDNPLAGWNVLSPKDNLDSVLEQTMSQYAQNHICLLHNSLHVPLLVLNYLEYVSSIQRPECEHSSSDTSSNQSRETRSALIDFVKEYTPVRSFILARKDVQILDQITFNLNLNFTKQNKSSPITDDVIRIDRHIVTYVADYDIVMGGILDNLAKANAIAQTPTKGKDKKSYQLPPSDNCSQHSAHSKISERLSKLCVNSRRLELLSKLTPGKSPLLYLLNWNVQLEGVFSHVELEMSRGNFVLVLELLYYVLTPRTFLGDARLRQIYDSVLLELATTCDTYILDVTYLPTMADFVLNNQQTSSLKCLQYLTARSHEIDADRADKVARQFFLAKINHEIIETCGLTSWNEADELNPYIILEKIIASQDVDLAQRWCVYRNLPHEPSPDLEVLQQYVIFLLSTHNQCLAEDLCSSLTPTDLRELCSRMISSDCDVTYVKVIVSQALSSCTEQSGEDYERYMRTVIGVDILSLMDNGDQKLYRHLISHPYLLIEQLILLTRLSLLEKILVHIKPYLIPADTVPDNIPAGRLLQSEIDALLRTYATKALDFRICDVTGSGSSSMSSSRTVLRNDKYSFSPPRTPPSKDQWIPNDECTQCMVCRVTIFSMFNRRHHCRRCGRLVCGACSQNKMKVSGYGGVAVRVCTQCHQYASPRIVQLEITCLSPSDGTDHPTFQSSEPTLREEFNYNTTLREEFNYNTTLREEFSYEYAPSVSLCLSILKFHSNNTTLAMYLCETCTSLLHVMKPSNREIDYGFVIRMIKCLVLACKVIYDVHGIESATLDEICTQVNLLSILVTNNCCHLIPDKPLVGLNALRQLRDSLLKEERWSLALEVSTKAGLDYNSVWTVWGKACLKAGAWSDARNIFAKCHFDKRENSTLIDILQILQSDMYSGDLSSRLSKLKAPMTSPTENGWYEECLYYLHTYGSVPLILTFFVHREQLRQALDYVLEKQVAPDMFVEHVFFRCLKLGMTDILYSLMEQSDPSLLLWKVYLRAVCSHCERNCLLNVLYAIQLRTRDHVRGAITCVMFYLKDVHSYVQLSEKKYHLTNARGHLNDYRAEKMRNQLGMHMSATELDKQLLLFHYQTKLVSTIVSTSDEMANRSSTRVPTLFGGADEKAALLLDIISLDMGREDGTSQKYRDLCKETVSVLKLNPVSIYSELVRLLAKQSRLQDIKDMIASLKQDLGRSCDDILVAAIRQKPAQVEQLICLLSKIPLQISMFIEAGKLKSAYLLSVKHNRLDDIRIIAQQAKILNQTAILNICTKKIALEESKLESEQNRKSAKSEEEAKQKGPKYDSKNGSVREKTRAKPSTSGNIRQSGDGQPSTCGNVRQSGNSQRISSSESTPSSSQDKYQGKASPSKLSTEQSRYASIASVLKAYEQKSTKERSDASKTKTVYVQDKPESSSNFDSIASVLKAYQQKSLQQTASPSKSKTVSAQGKTESSSEFDSIASVLKAYEQKSPKSYAFSRSDTSKGSISSSPKRRDEQYGSASKKILKSKKDHGISRGRVLETSSSKSDDPSPSKIAQERDSSRLTSRDSGLASSVERPSGGPLESPSNSSKLGSNRTPSDQVSKPDQSKPSSSSSSSSQGTSEQGQSKGKVSTGQGGPQESPSRLKSRLNIFKPS
ncbi:hypothetical protein M8J75_001226 [Diaphorina citri]|nr:hypothetical protein M8J75_001226 [Diaphorina citri]